MLMGFSLSARTSIGRSRQQFQSIEERNKGQATKGKGQGKRRKKQGLAKIKLKLIRQARLVGGSTINDLLLLAKNIRKALFSQ